jgi:hypothetical protein
MSCAAGSFPRSETHRRPLGARPVYTSNNYLGEWGYPGGVKFPNLHEYWGNLIKIFDFEATEGIVLA